MKKAFTLSEVLVTLGIVGIVAVLTIPTIMKNYRRKVYVSQLQKVYSQLSNAATTMMGDEQAQSFYESTGGVQLSCSDPANGKCEKGVGYFLTNYLKTIKNNCGDTNNTNACVATAYKTMDGTAIQSTSYGDYCVQTANGAAVCGTFNSAITCTTLVVDVNGKDEPNVAGLDVFTMDIHKDGSISDYGSGCADGANGVEASECGKGASDHIFKAPGGCLNALIESGWKMNY